MMDQQPEKRNDRSFPGRKGLKRKLEEEDEFEISAVAAGGVDALLSVVAAQVSVLSSTFSWKEADRAAAKRATKILAHLAKNEDFVDVIVEGGAVPLLVKHLQAPPYDDGDESQKPFEHGVEKGSAYALAYIAIKREHQNLIIDNGALPHLLNLLKRNKNGYSSRSVIRRAADAIINLSHENNTIKTLVGSAGGIPTLVELLEFADPKVQRSAAGALRSLSFKNDTNKNQIINYNALPMLILLLGSDDAAVHYEAVGVIGNLVLM